MKNIYILTLIAIITITFSACRKDRGPKAVGFVVQTGTSTPIEGATVNLYICESFTGGCTLDRTLTTSSDGAYEFLIDDNETRKIQAYHPEYFDDIEGFFALYKDDYAYDLELTPHAYIKLHVENVAPVNQFDNIRFWGGFSQPIEDNIGETIDITKVHRIRGNRQSTINWKVIKNGVQTIFQDSIYVPAHDTLHYEILY